MFAASAMVGSLAGPKAVHDERWLFINLHANGVTAESRVAQM